MHKGIDRDANKQSQEISQLEINILQILRHLIIQELQEHMKKKYKERYGKIKEREEMNTEEKKTLDENIKIALEAYFHHLHYLDTNQIYKKDLKNPEQYEAIKYILELLENQYIKDDLRNFIKEIPQISYITYLQTHTDFDQEILKKLEENIIQQKKELLTLFDTHHYLQKEISDILKYQEKIQPDKQLEIALQTLTKLHA